MIVRRRTIQQIVEEQVQKWQFAHVEAKPRPTALTVVTISREPGSGGRLIAQGIAEKMKFDLFHQEVIHQMAESAQVSERLLESLDEKGLSMIEDWAAVAIQQRHLWPDQYLQHLLKVIGTIGKHGRCVIVGRGANFILPAEGSFRVRVIAPRKFRAQKVAEEYKISPAEAERRIIRTDSDRRAFIRKYFNEDIADPLNYDLILNTGVITLDESVTAVCAILSGRS